MSLPERINVIRTVTYYVPDIVSSLEDMGEEDINIDRVMEYIEDWVAEEFGGLSGLVFQDQDGNEL